MIEQKAVATFYYDNGAEYTARRVVAMQVCDKYIHYITEEVGSRTKTHKIRKYNVMCLHIKEGNVLKIHKMKDSAIVKVEVTNRWLRLFDDITELEDPCWEREPYTSPSLATAGKLKEDKEWLIGSLKPSGTPVEV